MEKTFAELFHDIFHFFFVFSFVCKNWLINNFTHENPTANRAGVYGEAEI